MPLRKARSITSLPGDGYLSAFGTASFTPRLFVDLVRHVFDGIGDLSFGLAPCLFHVAFCILGLALTFHVFLADHNAGLFLDLACGLIVFAFYFVFVYYCHFFNPLVFVFV